MKVLNLFIISGVVLLNSTVLAQGSRVEIITKSDDSDKPQTTVNNTVIKETVIKEKEGPRNYLKFLAGSSPSDLRKIKTTKVEDENGNETKTLTGIPSEDKMLYGVGYERLVGSLSIGISYMSNKTHTVEVTTFSIGLGW